MDSEEGRRDFLRAHRFRSFARRAAHRDDDRRKARRIANDVLVCRASGVAEGSARVRSEQRRRSDNRRRERAIRSEQARKIVFGRVPAPGEVLSPPKLPAHAWDYKMGGAFGIVMNAAGVRIYHNGSADLIDAEIAGERVDVLIAGLAGRQSTRDYLKRLLDALTPDLVVPDASRRLLRTARKRAQTTPRHRHRRLRLRSARTRAARAHRIFRLRREHRLNHHGSSGRFFS